MRKKSEKRDGDRRSRADLDGPALIGRNSLRELLKFAPQRVRKVYLAPGETEEFRIALKEHSIPVEPRSAEDLSSLVGSQSHQGVVAVLKPREHLELPPLLDQLQERDRSLILILDSIYGPHNLGAILRAAECFGVSAVIISRNRGVGITPVVTKVSVGASELVPVVVVSNLHQALLRCQKKGYVAIAADVGEGTLPLAQCEFAPHTVLVLGSEGEGIQRLLLDCCDSRLTIPMCGAIDSLNVSQATAVMLYQWSLNAGNRSNSSRKVN